MYLRAGSGVLSVVMRELLAVAVETAEVSSTAAAAVVLGIISVVVVVPALLLCGDCLGSGKKPDQTHAPPGPQTTPGAVHHYPPSAQAWNGYAVPPPVPPPGSHPGPTHAYHSHPYPPGYIHNYSHDPRAGPAYHGPPIPGHPPTATPGNMPSQPGITPGPAVGPAGHHASSDHPPGIWFLRTATLRGHSVCSDCSQ